MANAEETKQNENDTVSSSDSKTKVHFSESAVYKYLSGRREPISVRIDTGLYSVFKPLSKRIYGSTCKAIEIYMIALIEAVESRVHFSDTNKPIQIDKIIIERNIRNRRNLELGRDKGTDERQIKCGFKNCQNKAVGKAIYLPKKKQYYVCFMHLEEACIKSKSWKVTQN